MEDRPKKIVRGVTPELTHNVVNILLHQSAKLPKNNLQN